MVLSKSTVLGSNPSRPTQILSRSLDFLAKDIDISLYIV